MSLRDRLLRSSFLTLVVAATIAVAPVVVFGAVYAVLAWPLSQIAVMNLVVLGGWLVLALCGLAVGRRMARRAAEDIAEPMTDLAVQAGAIGRRPPPKHSLESGIEEVDAVSEVLRQRALEITQRLASEREFASDASHQLRTPLTALLIRLEEITLLDDPVEMREEAAVCITQVERLTRVVDDLLRRTPAGPDGELADTPLDSVLAELQQEWQPTYARARRSIKVVGQRGLRLHARRDDLLQIISTLLENSLKHGAGLVEVGAEQSGPSVVLEVGDEGQGVDLALAPYIFERRVTTGGTGLGLGLARDLAQANGGRLELVEAQPARFGLFLSASADPPEEFDPSLL
ncbi:ATP-binding protein [Demetria terragena]|uniref:ATP-binding protein n=1 Tax=Demetria terragena TaxID=63959 RepID=UPI000370E94A|nr:HAMP domain-containing sensor histidine kinase [Demetria terragena]